MLDRLDELLQRGLGTGAPHEDDGRKNLGAQVRLRAARQDRLRRNAIVAAGAVVLLTGIATLARNGRDGNFDGTGQLAHTQTHAPGVDRDANTNHAEPTGNEIAAMVEEFGATAQLVRQTVEQMKIDEQTRQLRRELGRYETQNVMDPAIDQTVAIGLADARRLASTHPDEAGRRLSRLVELFPGSSLAADAKNQLHQLQNREVMP